MAEIFYDINVPLAEVPINLLPLVDDTDFKSIETAVAGSSVGLKWNFSVTSGSFAQTAVTAGSAGNYALTNQGGGMYSIYIPASAGASINNNTAGFGWFSGSATGILPWRSPVFGFRTSTLNDNFIDGTIPLASGSVASEVWTNATRTLTSVASFGLASGSSVALIPTNTASASSVALIPINTASASSVDSIPNEILSSTLTGSYTILDGLKIIASILAGTVSGGGDTTIIFNLLGTSGSIVKATVDGNGNRSEVLIQV